MARIMIKCPKTGKMVPTGMGTDRESFETSTFRDNAVQCAACGETHLWQGQDAVLDEG